MSGVVFTIGDATIRRAASGRSIFFCCEACAGYFDAHERRVLAARALTSAEKSVP